MALIKHEFPILERDTAQDAIIMPNRREQYSFPENASLHSLKMLSIVLLLIMVAKK